MKLGQYGIFAVTDAMSGSQLTEMCQRLEAMGCSTVWYPEAFNYETFAIGGYLLANSSKLIVGSGIANIYARDPSASVMGHNTLNGLYNNRFVLGLGVSHAPLVSDMRGHEYKGPLTTMKDYLNRMDAAWEALGGWQGEKQVVLAALGPKMSALSAERTVGAFPYNITPEHVAPARAAMGSAGLIICEQKICLCEDPVKAREVARAALAPYLPLPNYYNNWFRLGFDKSDLENGGSDRLMDAMVLWGDAAKIKAGLQQYLDNGADQVVIQAIRTDGDMQPDYAALEAVIG